MKNPSVYILASKRDGVLYIGVTSNLAFRMSQHEQGLLPGFSKKYRLKWLVYYEMYESMAAAILREKQLNEWRRAWKVRLIEGSNPEWRNLFDPDSGEISFSPADLERERG